MKLTQEDIDKIILIQANVRGYLVRQQITRQLMEIYEYEKEHLEYIQGQQFNEVDYYSSEYGLNYDLQDQKIQKMYQQQIHKQDYAKQSIQNENFRKSNQDDDNNNSDDENIEYQNSSSCSSGAEIEKKVQEKFRQQQAYIKEKQQAQEYQLYGKDTNKQQKANHNTIDMPTKQNKDGYLATQKNEAMNLKFPHLNPIFSNSQMKQLVNNSDSFEHQQDEESINENKEKLHNFAQKLKNEEEDISQYSPENYKIRLYSQSAYNYDENEDESIQEIQKHQIEKENEKNIGKQKQNDYNYQQQHYKENQPSQDYLNQKSVNISVEITESNLLSEKRLYLQPISNHNNQYNIQKNSALQSKNHNQQTNNNQMKNPQSNANNNKINQNRFYQDDEQYYINQQINLYQQAQKNHQYVNPKQNDEKYVKDKNQQNIIQIIDQFNYSPQSQISNPNNHRDEHFHKISNIEYRSYPGDNFLFEDSQNYAAYQRENQRGDYYHHEHHAQQASFMEPQENNELIINKSIFIKNMGVIKQMQEEQKRLDAKTHSIAHEKNMKKIRKMCHQHPILNSKNHKQFLQMSKYSLESFNSSQQEGIDELESKSLLETSQQQKHNNGQIFEFNGSEQGSMMSSRVPESSILKSNKNSLQNRQKQNNLGSINKKTSQPIMFDFDIYILAATKIQKVFKGYLSRKHIIEYKQIKRATLLIESYYLRFKQFLVKKMKDCTNQIECSSYNIIKFVQDFEKGEKFLKSQFRKKNFDQKIKINRDKLCKVFISFINNKSDDKPEESKNMTLEQENLKLQKEVLSLKQGIIIQQKNYKNDLEAMQQKYDELRSLHKETIKKYISGIQNLSQKRRGSNQQGSSSPSSRCQEQTLSSQQFSPSYNRNKQAINDSNKDINKNNHKLIDFYKESDQDQLNKIKLHNYDNQLDCSTQQSNLQQTQVNGKIKTKASNNHTHQDENKRSQSKSPDHYNALKRFELLKDEAERDLQEFEKRIKKIKYEYTQQKSPATNTNKKQEQKQQIQNSNGKKTIKNGSLENDKQQKNKQKNNNLTKYNDYEYYCSDNNSIQQFMSQEFINYNKNNLNSSKK